VTNEGKHSLESQFGQCALCLKHGQLRTSHIIPAFAFRWLRSRSITGHIRGVTAPNLRIQDGEKARLLCSDCEQLFSREEAAFSSLLFKPVLRGEERVNYSAWLLRFCTSVSWRVLKHCKGQNPDTEYTAEQEKLAVDAERTWAQFLQGEIPHPGQFEQHLLVFTEVHGEPAPHLPDNLNRYILGGVEMDIIGGKQSLMTFAKIGRFALFGIVQPPAGKWVNTKVHVRDGTVRPGVFQASAEIGDFLLSRARQTRAAVYDKMSPVQHQKVQDQLAAIILADPEAFMRSDHGKAILADAKMFGENAILLKR